MPNPDYTHLLLIADCSGSMRSIADDMNGGLKKLLEEQAALPGTLRVDLVTFDSEVKYVAKDLPPEGIQFPVIEPRGMTALFDGIGVGVSKLGEALEKFFSEEDRPGKVIVVIITDGAENSSKEWSRDGVKALITQQETKYSWEFVFLGANIDSATVGAGIGLSKGSTANYTASPDGAAIATASVSSYLVARRGGDDSSTIQQFIDASSSTK